MREKSLIGIIKKLKKSGKRESKSDMPKDLFMKCPNCKEFISTEKLEENIYTCPKCNHHFPISPNLRLLYLLDDYEDIGSKYRFKNPIDFPSYKEIIKKYSENLDIEEAVKVVLGNILDVNLVVVVMDNRFLMGSMGTYVGEEITKAFEYALNKNLPIVVFSTSGGARMQEGIFSLMQMAKTSAIVKKFHESRNLFISCMTHPTTGGVTASFASLGDINIAEPKALIGFAGPRVIRETIKGELPEGFQSSEFLMETGFLDDIIHRKNLRDYIYRISKIHNYGVVKID